MYILLASFCINSLAVMCTHGIAQLASALQTHNYSCIDARYWYLLYIIIFVDEEYGPQFFRSTKQFKNRSTHERSRFYYYSNEIGSFCLSITTFNLINLIQFYEIFNVSLIKNVVCFLFLYNFRISSKISLHIPTRA